MRLLICGDRKWSNKESIKQELITIQPDIVIHGACRGADQLADEAAKELGIECSSYPAQWYTYGKAAGPIRNQRMIDEGNPDFVLAFHSDIANSKGTKDMVERAYLSGIPTRVIRQ